MCRNNPAKNKQKTLLDLEDEKGMPTYWKKTNMCYWLGGRARCTMLRSKLSQDHLELFFSSVRARGGFNNNPTAKQFTAADKLLLVKHQVKTGKDNCLLKEGANIFEVTLSLCQ